jgi:hypothetical protein
MILWQDEDFPGFTVDGWPRTGLIDLQGRRPDGLRQAGVMVPRAMIHRAN